jgi:hypothetical protein
MSHIALTHCVSTTLAAASAVQLNSIFLAKMNPRENPGGGTWKLMCVVLKRILLNFLVGIFD